MSHGSPFRPLTDYLYENRIAQVPLDQFDFDLVAFGQTHVPFEGNAGRPKMLNPGAVGQSRHRPRAACAAVVDAETMNVDFLEYRYDPTDVIRIARENGAGDWIERHLVDEGR